jgi:hypothetical protein
LPPAITDALEGIREQTRLDVFEPLIWAPSLKDQVEAVRSLYQVYWRHHVSTALLLLTAVGDPQRAFALAMRGLESAEETLRAHRPDLGDDASTAALLGVHTIKRAVRGLAGAPKSTPFP